NFTISTAQEGESSFTIDVLAPAGQCIIYPNQADLTGMSVIYGTSILSDDPNTAAVNDATVVTVENCVEICNDGIDNDGDGLIDCEDGDCYLVSNTGGTDTDGDGIDNDCDLDDDNDGILDTEESICNVIVTPSGYDAYWPLDNSTNDISGNSHNLQAGSVTFSTDSRVGSHAASFNGTSEYLQYSDGTFLNQAITSFSFSFWIKPNDFTGI
ncbi:MAG: hypothetical protein GY751_09375, partial [Bacteroidetes bacterium]|nr:hypothetical protein [Bacteroidota bacterium]